VCDCVYFVFYGPCRSQLSFLADHLAVPSTNSTQQRSLQRQEQIGTVFTWLIVQKMFEGHVTLQHLYRGPGTLLNYVELCWIPSLFITVHCKWTLLDRPAPLSTTWLLLHLCRAHNTNRTFAAAAHIELEQRRAQMHDFTMWDLYGIYVIVYICIY